MQIEFERSGGFAGMSIRTSINTDVLPSADAKEIGQLVNSAEFFNLPASTKKGPGADQFNYRLTIQVEDLVHTVETTDSTMPDNLKPLVNRLMTQARQRTQ